MGKNNAARVSVYCPPELKALVVAEAPDLNLSELFQRAVWQEIQRRRAQRLGSAATLAGAP